MTTQINFNQIKGEYTNVLDFGASPTATAAANVIALNAALAYAGTQGSTYTTVVNGLTAGVYAQLPTLYFPPGQYNINAQLNAPGYFNAYGPGAALNQTNVAADIFHNINDGSSVGGAPFRWHIDGLQFVGGLNQINIANVNTADMAMYLFENCEFILSQAFAIKTATSSGTDRLSANLTVRKCRFDRPKQVITNVCDSALFEDCWVNIAKENFTANTAAFINAAATGETRLTLRNMFGVPSMGTTSGARDPRMANVRWVDNYGLEVNCDACRFGGEDGGLSIIWNFKAPTTVAPYNRGANISINNSWCYAGPSSASDSAAIVCFEVPQTISIKNNTGFQNTPFVLATTLTFPTYFTTWETASGQYAYDFFHFDISNNQSSVPDYTAGALGLRFPDGLQPYLVNGRMGRFSVAAQTVANSGAAIPLSWTLVDDNLGVWQTGNPTRIFMPWGCTRMKVTVFVSAGLPVTAGGFGVRVNYYGATTEIAGVFSNDNAGITNPTEKSFSVIIYGTARTEVTPTSYWKVDVYNLSATNNVPITGTVTVEACNLVC